MKKSRKIAVLLVAVGLVFVGEITARAEEEEEIRVQYKVGEGTFIGNGDNLVHIAGRVQPRFTYNGLEGAPDTDTFTIQRGRIKIDGHTLKRKLRFEFQMNLSTSSKASTTPVCTDAGCTTTVNAVTAESTTGLATLLDYSIDYVPYTFFGVKVGQFKVPFLMAELTSSAKQQFVDRSAATGFFNLQRDLGVTFHGEAWENGLKYDAFFMNGDGQNTINRNQSLMLGTRLELPILGTYKNSESDTDNSQEHNLGVGIAYAFNDLGAAFVNSTIPAGSRTSFGTLDAGYKYKGFSFQGAGMISRNHEGVRLTNLGWNAQAGYFFVPKIFEVALRSAAAIFSDAITNQYEYAATLNYFIKGHGIKIQTDYSFLMNARGLNLNDHRVRTQLQVVF